MNKIVAVFILCIAVIVVLAQGTLDVSDFMPDGYIEVETERFCRVDGEFSYDSDGNVSYIAQCYVEGAPLPTDTPVPTAVPTVPSERADLLQLLDTLTVAEENRCSPYNKSSHYRYPQSVELSIIAAMDGVIYGPYTGTYFNSRFETDIEHIIPTSEAHDSGLCGEARSVRRAFASDLLNLTLASPSVNRYQKSGKDFGEWIPSFNVCWFAYKNVHVRSHWHLTVDAAEKAALVREINMCDSFELQFQESHNWMTIVH